MWGFVLETFPAFAVGIISFEMARMPGMEVFSTCNMKISSEMYSFGIENIVSAYLLILWIRILANCSKKMSNSSSIKSSCNHIASQAAKIRATYFVSVDNKAIIDCFFDT